MIISAITNDKGGVGKSALTSLLGQALSTAGFKVLLIDNDPQGTLSAENMKIPKDSPGMDEVYSGNMKLIELVCSTHVNDNLFVVPAGLSLKDVVINMNKNDDAESRVERLYDQMFEDEFQDSLDFVLIDNPPSDIGHPRYCTINAHKIIMPAVPDDHSFSALYRAYGYMMENYPNWEEQKVYIVPSLVKGRKLQKRFIKAMRKEFSGKNENTVVTEHGVSDSADVPETLMLGKNLFISRNSGKVTKEIKYLCLEIFDELDEKDFMENIEEVVNKTKKERRDKFIEMARERAKNRKSGVGEPSQLDKIKAGVLAEKS